MKKIVLLFLFLVGCNTTNLKNIETHPIYDKYLELHRYDKKIIINDEKELIEFCQEHFAWERITESYTKQGIKYLIREI